jgi:pimeloyl-ACP methyl ester carboxylesterase
MTTWRAPGGETLDAGLYVRIQGSGPRTLLLLHGLAGSNRYFGAAFDALGAHARMIVPDLLGFGGSPRPDDVDYGPHAHAQAVLDALDRLDVRGPLCIGAHSAGALVAIEIAAMRPERVTGLVVFGPPFYASPAEARAHLSKLGPFVRYLAMDTRAAHWACEWMCRNRALAAKIARWSRPDLPVEVAEDGVRHSWISYSRTVRHLILLTQPPHQIDSVSAPMRWIFGTDDAVVDPDFLDRLARSLADVRVERWPGGHDLPLSTAERCIEALLDLVREMETPRQ